LLLGAIYKISAASHPSSPRKTKNPDTRRIAFSSGPPALEATGGPAAFDAEATPTRAGEEDGLTAEA
jgi:hypothetical protein